MCPCVWLDVAPMQSSSSSSSSSALRPLDVPQTTQKSKPARANAGRQKKTSANTQDDAEKEDSSSGDELPVRLHKRPRQELRSDSRAVLYAADTVMVLSPTPKPANTDGINEPYYVDGTVVMTSHPVYVGDEKCRVLTKTINDKLHSWTGEEKTVDVEHLVNPELVRLSQRGASYIIYGTPAPSKSTYIILLSVGAIHADNWR